MDVCTFILGVTVTLLGCMSPPRCEIDGGRQFCMPATVTACAPPPSYYACKRPDGSEYRLTADKQPVNR